jgi:type IV pilus assembly protein PilZ
MSNKTIDYVIKEALELSLSYMPFVKDGGLFIPTKDPFSLGDNIVVNLQLPGKKEALTIEGKVIWVTPKNALHHVASGVGVQFTGTNAKKVQGEIEASLDKGIDVGGYTYGITDQLDRTNNK